MTQVYNTSQTNKQSEETTSIDLSRDFKGIWIPKDIWLHPELNCMEKCLAAEIDSLDGPQGCFASNEYLMNFMGLKESAVRAIISKLKKLGLIELLSFDGRKRILRGYSKLSHGGLPARILAVPPPEKRRAGTKKIHIDERKEERKDKGSELALRRASSLFEKIQENNPKAKKPNLKTWACDLEKMNRLDDYTWEEIDDLITFSQGHDFWHRQILSAANLRSKAHRLVLEQKAATKQSPIEEKEERLEANSVWTKEFKRKKAYGIGQVRAWDGWAEVKVQGVWQRVEYSENGYQEQFRNLLEKGDLL